MLAKRATFRGASTTVKRFMIGTAFVLTIALGLFLHWVLHTQTYVLATTHQPETYTELYFTTPNQLPSTVRSGQTVPVNFTIHNVEARNMDYVYDIVLTTPSGQSEVLTQQQLELTNGATKKVAAKTPLPTGVGRNEISVVLVGKPEAIHYWVEATS